MDYYGGHNYSNDWTVDKEATCTKDGSKSHHCTRCDDKSDVTVIAAHGTELKGAKEATCTSEGYTGDKVCKADGKVVEKGTVIPTLAHNYKDGKCIVCGTVDLNYTPAKSDDNTNSPETGDDSNITL